MRAEKTLVNVNKGQDAYSVIGNYILNHVTAIEDMIAVIQINGVIIKELYMVDVDADGYFYWKSDWWEGEEDVALLDFFPVSDAERIQEGEQDDYISRKGAIDEIRKCRFVVDAIEKIRGLPSAESDVPDTSVGDMISRQWIPCSERLPKEEKRHYWVCTDTGYQCQCRWTNDVYGLGASDRWEWKIFDIPQYQKVIAWMPLPEPYEERRTDD